MMAVNPDPIANRNSTLGYPELAPIALLYLAMPSSSASAERLFSMAGFFSEGNRQKISAELLKAQTLARYNEDI